MSNVSETPVWVGRAPRNVTGAVIGMTGGLMSDGATTGPGEPPGPGPGEPPGSGPGEPPGSGPGEPPGPGPGPGPGGSVAAPPGVPRLNRMGFVTVLELVLWCSSMTALPVLSSAALRGCT